MPPCRACVQLKVPTSKEAPRNRFCTDHKGYKMLCNQCLEEKDETPKKAVKNGLCGKHNEPLKLCNVCNKNMTEKSSICNDCFGNLIMKDVNDLFVRDYKQAFSMKIQKVFLDLFEDKELPAGAIESILPCTVQELLEYEG